MAKWWHCRALASFEALGDGSGGAQTLDLVAVASVVGRDRRAAILAFEQSAAAFRELNDRRGLASVLATVGELRCACHV